MSTPSLLSDPADSTDALVAVPSHDASLSSGPSPTLHLIGAGKVGRAFLRLLPDLPLRLVAVSDRSATLFAREGLDAQVLADWKSAGRPFAQHPRAAGIPLDIALSVAHADVVVDCTDSNLEPDARRAAVERAATILRRGQRLVLAAKTPLLSAHETTRDRLGINAVLGGTGRALLAELDELNTHAIAIACVANATTSAVISALERGHSLDEGLARARALGLLERDPAQDLDGRDAAVKLALVTRLVFGRDVELDEVRRPDPAELDPKLFIERRARGATTRLVGRATRSGELTLAYEEIALGSRLAIPSSCVAYTYALESGATRVHLGDGIGPEKTARALVTDVVELARIAARRAA